LFASQLNDLRQFDVVFFFNGYNPNETGKFSFLWNRVMGVLFRFVVVWMAVSFLINAPSELCAQTGKGKGQRKPKAIRKTEANKDSAGVNDYSSKNFVLHTDLSATESKELLERLEKMLGLVSGYYGRPNSQIIEMNVVKNRESWSSDSIPIEARDSIHGEAGITLSLTMSQQDGFGEKQIVGAKSIVWSVSTRGIPQHEAVHAYCHQAFGRTGPTWYAEGMAELGKYWRDKSEGVQIEDEVMTYLKESTPVELTDITALDHQTGDNWQNYAWRWALCHLLSTNPNYSPRFKPLGMALLNGQKTRFEDVYGPMAQEISFEYLFFLKHMEQGYRCELCAWDWKTRFLRLRGTATAQAKINANRGWQASRVAMKKGDKIAYTVIGEWTLEKGGPKISSDGDEDGQGKLIGVLFDDYRLSEPFDLGQQGEYEATSDGNLFIRCRDEWNSVADNAGIATIKFKVAN
jgi:hypothetical protein